MRPHWVISVIYSCGFFILIFRFTVSGMYDKLHLKEGDSMGHKDDVLMDEKSGWIECFSDR